jgi:hypothetical protein
VEIVDAGTMGFTLAWLPSTDLRGGSSLCQGDDADSR